MRFQVIHGVADSGRSTKHLGSGSITFPQFRHVSVGGASDGATWLGAPVDSVGRSGSPLFLQETQADSASVICPSNQNPSLMVSH
jgi:hypothetical protein